jgi:hypothetical protein
MGEASAGSYVFITGVETCGWWLLAAGVFITAVETYAQWRLAARVFPSQAQKRTRTWTTTVVTMLGLSRHQAAGGS